MAGLTDAEEQAIINHWLGKASYTMPANLWIGLSTTTPTDAGGNVTEPSGNGYARVSTAPADWNSASGTAPAASTNANAVTFPAATGSWGTVTHFTVHSASTAGTVKAWGALTTSQAIGNGNTPSFAAGSLTIAQLGDPSDTY